MTPALEPLYTLRVAAEMIPCLNVGVLRDFLYKHRRQFPARTLPMGRAKYPRMLTLTEVTRIRGYRLREGKRVQQWTRTTCESCGQKLPDGEQRGSMSRTKRPLPVVVT